MFGTSFRFFALGKSLIHNKSRFRLQFLPPFVAIGQIWSSLLAGGLCVYLSRKKPGKRGVRDHRRHLGCTRKSVWGKWCRRSQTPHFAGFFRDKNTHKSPVRLNIILVLPQKKAFSIGQKSAYNISPAIDAIFLYKSLSTTYITLKNCLVSWERKSFLSSFGRFRTLHVF